MKTSDIKEMAEIDLKIDRSQLTEASIDTPMLINKYYMIYIEEGRILKILEQKILELYKDKYDYYLHLAPPETYTKKPFNRKVLKSDVDMYISADSDFIDLNNKIENQKFKVKYLEEIIKQLNSRSFLISNIIKHEIFKAGG